MDNLVWSRRKTDGSVTTMELSCGTEVMGELMVDDSKKTEVATVGNESIRLTVEKHSAVAQLSDEVYFRAESKAKTFGRAEEVVVDLNGRALKLINESKANWIVEDETGTKIGQFTGANHGVRNVVVEMEPEALLSPTEACFVAWLARIVLEEKLLGLTTVLTIMLAILTPLIIAFFLF